MYSNKLTESVTAALQMMYACLSLTPIAGRVVDITIRSMDEDSGDPRLRIFDMELLVRLPDGVDQVVWVSCHLRRTDVGWTDGLCRINRATPGWGWQFLYDMSVPGSTPRPYAEPARM